MKRDISTFQIDIYAKNDFHYQLKRFGCYVTVKMFEIYNLSYGAVFV